MTTRFHALLEKKITEAIKDRSDSLVVGQADDYPKYKEGVGYIYGLRTALALCEDVEQDLGNERSNSI
jgi:hypothetical protein